MDTKHFYKLLDTLLYAYCSVKKTCENCDVEKLCNQMLKKEDL